MLISWWEEQRYTRLQDVLYSFRLDEAHINSAHISLTKASHTAKPDGQGVENIPSQEGAVNILSDNISIASFSLGHKRSLSSLLNPLLP